MRGEREEDKRERPERNIAGGREAYELEKLRMRGWMRRAEESQLANLGSVTSTTDAKRAWRPAGVLVC